MKTPEQLAERREKMRLYMAERRKDPAHALKNREAVAKWQRANREKANAAARAWRAKNKDRVRELNQAWAAKKTPEELSDYHRQAYRRNRRTSHLMSKFGITSEQYEAMIVAQDHKCALCGEHDSPTKRLAVDHCHATGKVRALLCDRCNRGLGYFGDSIAGLEEALRYLRRAYDVT